MKITRIYKETSSIEDMSKDRVELNLSWNEWNKINCFIELARWEIQDARLRKKAENLNNMFRNAQELTSVWIKEGEE